MPGCDAVVGAGSEVTAGLRRVARRILRRVARQTRARRSRSRARPRRLRRLSAGCGRRSRLRRTERRPAPAPRTPRARRSGRRSRRSSRSRSRRRRSSRSRSRRRGRRRRRSRSCAPRPGWPAGLPGLRAAAAGFAESASLGGALSPLLRRNSERLSRTPPAAQPTVRLVPSRAVRQAALDRRHGGKASGVRRLQRVPCQARFMRLAGVGPWLYWLLAVPQEPEVKSKDR